MREREVEEYYADWEWQPLENMPNGCCEVLVRDDAGNTRSMCSCDFWWKYEDHIKEFSSFRFDDSEDEDEEE